MDIFTSATHADLPEFLVGHAQDEQAGTGCTVFVAPEGAICGVDVRGGGPATRETDLLKPENMIRKVHAVMIGGGSAFGLEASCGAMEVLADKKIGFSIGPAIVPIVPGACLFDLLVGENRWPDKTMGAAACETAFAQAESESTKDTPIAQGNVGAGCGATVGKMGLPAQAMKSGFGWCGLALGDLVVVANVAVNAAGNVRDENGNWLAGTIGKDGRVEDPLLAAMQAKIAIAQMPGETAGQFAEETPCANTTLGVVLTNAKLTKAQCTKVAQITQDAYARAIYPVHTLNDGDTIFVMASDKVEAETDIVGIMATRAMECAIRNAVRHAKGAYGLKAACDL